MPGAVVDGQSVRRPDDQVGHGLALRVRAIGHLAPGRNEGGCGRELVRGEGGGRKDEAVGDTPPVRAWGGVLRPIREGYPADVVAPPTLVQ